MLTFSILLFPLVSLLVLGNVGSVNAKDNLPALMIQIGQEYVGGVAPCQIIRNAYDNYKDEMMNFRKIQQKCRSTPRIEEYNEACEFLMKPIEEDQSTSKRKERESRGKQNFIRRVYFALKNAVGDTTVSELSHLHVVNGLVTNAKSGKDNKVKPATAVCQHWATMADTCRGDNDKYQFGIYEVSTSSYCTDNMHKVYATCQALGLCSTLRP